MEIMMYTPDQLDDQHMNEITFVASRGFGRRADRSMRQDTESHVSAADHVQMVINNGELVGFAMYRLCLGGRAIELAGRAIQPEYQRHGTGLRLLREYVAQERPDYLTTYTRNPSVLRMMRRVGSEVFPLDEDQELRGIASEMSHATLHSDASVYHFNRYDGNGLFGGGRPSGSQSR